jgi:hypothetical protein
MHMRAGTMVFAEISDPRFDCWLRRCASVLFNLESKRHAAKTTQWSAMRLVIFWRLILENTPYECWNSCEPSLLIYERTHHSLRITQGPCGARRKTTLHTSTHDLFQPLALVVKAVGRMQHNTVHGSVLELLNIRNASTCGPWSEAPQFNEDPNN